MKTIQTKGVRGLGLLILLFLCSVTPGLVHAQEDEQPAGQINFELAIMLTGQSKTFTAESDFFPDIMIIPVALYGSSTLNISVSKLDSMGDIIGVILQGYGHPEMAYTTGVTPCTISIKSRFWDYGTAYIVSGILFSLNKGPFRYSVTLSY